MRSLLVGLSDQAKEGLGCRPSLCLKARLFCRPAGVYRVPWRRVERAETSNQGGHTDILARQDGHNLFICECKFWSGTEGFTDTIDQLFGYIGWRDTKLAIVMFVREKGLTSVLKKAKATLASHPQFVGWKVAASETELRVKVHWPGDDERLADLNVFFVHTPKAKS